MKKYLLLLLLFLILLSLKLGKSYSYVDCNNYVLYPKEVSTLNLENYLRKVDYKELYYLCSYDYCYDIRSGNLNETIDDFVSLLDNNNSYENRLITNVKGYSVTKIGLNNCK